MKLLLRGLILSIVGGAFAEPVLDSWYLEGSRKYARIYGYESDVISQNAMTTWRNPNSDTGQDEPTYAGVHEVSYDANNVYVRSSGLGSHIMGPWWGNRHVSTADEDIFGNWPGSRAFVFEIPIRANYASIAVPNNRSETGGGVIGIFVDGVAMFDGRDAFSWDPEAAGGAGATVNGAGFWEQDAYWNESQTFDNAFAHQAAETYHYHASPPALRYQLGDSVSYDASTNGYTENASPTGHSPILGWAQDGLPIYGPYGYSVATDPNSGVRRMLSGYQVRPDLANDGDLRDALPTWVTRYKTIAGSDNINGPAVSAHYQRGHYLQDYEYLGDVGQVQGVHYDLDEFNTRFCYTPEFPNGVQAYFVSIEPDGTPKFPYNIGRRFYARPTGAAYNNSDDRGNNDFVLPADAVIYAQGGPESAIECAEIETDSSSGDVTLTWVGAEGGSYEILHDNDLLSQNAMQDELIDGLTNGVPKGGITESGILSTESKKFYRVCLEQVASFDDTGFVLDSVPEQYFGSTVTFTLTSPAPSDLSVMPSSVLLNGEAVDIVGRPTQNEVTIRYDASLLTSSTALTVTFVGYTNAHTGFYSTPSSTHSNVLFVIIDDWGVDSSPIDNVAGAYNGLAGIGGQDLPEMPNLLSLASQSYQFTNAYVQAACSTTRMAIMSGRHPSSNGVGSPGGSANSRDSQSIMTIAEAVDVAAPAYASGLFGKWHLGSGTTNNGPQADGWDIFYGDVAGNIANYFHWNRSNLDEITINQAGQNAFERTYGTIANTDDALDFINTQYASDTPWFCWLAYNAPHTQEENPTQPVPPTSINGETYTGATDSNRDNYKAALWAVDQELGRLMSSIDLESTTIILVGDNGTPSASITDTNLFPPEHGKGTIYNGGLHVPFLIRPAGGVAATKIDEPIAGVDLFPTFCDLMGIDSASLGQDLDGVTLTPLMGGIGGTDRIVVSETYNDAQSGRTLRNYNYKLNIHDDPLSNTDTPTVEFFDLSQGLDENSANDLLRSGYTMTSAEQAAYDRLIAENTRLNTVEVYYATELGTSSIQTFHAHLDFSSTSVSGVNASNGTILSNVPDIGSSNLQSVQVGNDTIGWVDALTGTLSRTTDGTTLDRYWVTFDFDEGLSNLATDTYDIKIQFAGGPRIYTIAGGYDHP